MTTVLFAHPLATILTLTMLTVFFQAGVAADPAPAGMMADVQSLAALGPVGLLLLVFVMIIRGDLRTRHEVESLRKALDRSEEQIDALTAEQMRTLTAMSEALKDRGGARVRG